MSFWYLQFSQKMNENNSTWCTIVVKLNIFVRFLGELKIPKRHFDINWPLARLLLGNDHDSMLAVLSWARRWMFSVIIPASIDSIFFDTIYDLGVTSFHSSVQWDVVKCLLIYCGQRFPFIFLYFLVKVWIQNASFPLFDCHESRFMERFMLKSTSTVDVKSNSYDWLRINYLYLKITLSF